MKGGLEVMRVQARHSPWITRYRYRVGASRRGSDAGEGRGHRLSEESRSVLERCSTPVTVGRSENNAQAEEGEDSRKQRFLQGSRCAGPGAKGQGSLRGLPM